MHDTRLLPTGIRASKPKWMSLFRLIFLTARAALAREQYDDRRIATINVWSALKIGGSVVADKAYDVTDFGTQRWVRICNLDYILFDLPERVSRSGRPSISGVGKTLKRRRFGSRPD